jgi:hypothetical protein
VAYLLHPDLYEPPETVEDWMLLQAAKWAGVPPWELQKQSAVWILNIWNAMEVENALRKQTLKTNNHKA